MLFRSPYSRSSLMSLLYKEESFFFKERDFCFRQLEKSLNKSFEHDLCNSSYDFVVLDLIEERLDVVEDERGLCITLTQELIKNFSFKATKYYRYNDPERIYKVKLAMRSLFSNCIERKITPVILNPSPAEFFVTKDGNVVSFNGNDCPSDFVEILNEYIVEARKIGYVVIDIPSEITKVSTIYHRWAPSEWHYKTDVYFYVNSVLKMMKDEKIASNVPSAELIFN